MTMVHELPHDSESQPSDLLARAPWVDPPPPERWTPLVVDPVDQLEELAGLLARGLLTEEEFVRQKRKVLMR
jgi:hypothetical protein